ncbi:hypothetical protein B0H63DRAFT_456091 [Podospora didyma]|uniref:Uncharacterized protein n=1 Tax=Podospora didyma TaxID=330526 RepID=A0AAE0JZ78_9PEZI|nr:hypothetical protein B0H63DRAFT_456091 [Podospora didyma]
MSKPACQKHCTPDSEDHQEALDSTNHVGTSANASLPVKPQEMPPVWPISKIVTRLVDIFFLSVFVFIVAGGVIVVVVGVNVIYGFMVYFGVIANTGDARLLSDKDVRLEEMSRASPGGEEGSSSNPIARDAAEYARNAGLEAKNYTVPTGDSSGIIGLWHGHTASTRTRSHATFRTELKYEDLITQKAMKDAYLSIRIFHCQHLNESDADDQRGEGASISGIHIAVCVLDEDIEARVMLGNALGTIWMSLELS